MKKLLLPIATVLGLTAPYAVHGQTATALELAKSTSSPDTSRSSANNRSISSSPTSSLAASDIAFLQDAAQSGLAEVQASQLAVTKASEQSVKDFARQMVKDHTQANTKLEQLARAKGITLPTQLSTVNAKSIKTLGAHSGAQFDQRYMDEYGQKAHRSTVEKFRKQAQTGRDADIQSFALQMLPTLEQHLKHAADMAKFGASR